MESLHRVFVGGLFDSITKDELRNRFQTFGNVTDVTIVHKKDGEGNSSKTFGYINLVTTTQKLNKCFAVYGGTKWKGCELKVQLAKEDFMARLQRERNEPVVKKKKKKDNSGPSKTYTDILETTSTMKKIVPGTPVEGERNWVIGKYGRPLPIVHIATAEGKKTVKVDPSKFCHCLKRIPDDIGDDRVNVDRLTWTYSDNEINLIHKKKKKKESKEDNMDGDSIETHIDNCNARTGDSIGYTEDTVSTNEEIEIQTLEKHKKKKRNRKMKENIPTPFPVDADDALAKGDGDVTKKIKHKQLDDVVVRTNIDEFSADNPNVEPVNKPEKKKLEEHVHTISTPVDPVLVIDRRKRKRKDKNMESSKQEYGDQSNNKVDLQSILVENEKKCDKILEMIEQDDKVKDSELVTCDIEKRKPKYSGSEHRKCKAICITDILFEDVPDDSIGNSKSKEDRLSTSIVEQLLSGSKTSTAGISRNDLSDDLLSTNGSQMAQNDKDENIEDCAEIENLFDFKFEDIGGKSKSFINTLFNNIEVRDNVDEIHENSGKSEEDSTSSNESFSDPENTKEPVMDMQSNNKVEFKERNCDDSMVENIGQIITNSNEISEDTEEQNNIVVNTDQIKISKKNACIDGGYHINNSKNYDGSCDKQIKKSKILNCNKQEKHAMSEEKRKKSLEARNSQISQNKGLVSKALKDVDKLATTNRVIFSESDNEEEPLQTAREVGTGEKGLWSDNDDDGDFSNGKTLKTQTKLFDDDADDEQTTGNEEIIVKSQFQGKEGEKLFRMQQRFGGDSRFKLDERFAGDAMEEENVDEDVETDATDATDDDDLQKEKEMNISVLEEVLGKSLSKERKERDYTYQRYDPDSAGHEKFEVIAKLCDKNATDDDEIEIRKVKTPTVQKLPEVSKDSFYTVDTSIKDLFGKGESASFSFLGNGNVTPQDDDVIQNASQNTGNEDQSKEVTDEQVESDCEEKMVTGCKKRLDGMLRSDETSEECNVISIENKDEVGTKMHTYLYIPDGDDRLDIGKRFIRTEGLEEITNQWKAIRRTLTEDYKKKHKDAVRYVRKMREKRFSKH